MNDTTLDHQAVKEPLVLLPGLLCDEALWRHQLDHLGDVAEPIVADLTGAESIADLASDVLSKAPPRFSLAGLSMGGYVAMEILRRAPDRVERLALIDTSARPDSAEQGRRRKGLINLARRGRFKGVTPQLLPQLVHPDRVEEEVLAGTVMAMAERVGRDAFIRQQTAIMGRVDSRESLRAVTCPALVIGGRQDQLTPPEITAEIADTLPNGELAIIEDCGHLSPLEQPQAVTALIRLWLRWT